MSGIRLYMGDLFVYIVSRARRYVLGRVVQSRAQSVSCEGALLEHLEHLECSH